LKPLINQDSINKWLETAKRGEKAVYYDGMLIAERERYFVSGGLADRMPEPMRVARIAWKAYMEGMAYLVQKKNGFMSYEYIIVKA
jgi:hypothetical protein